jgi:uncharacterized C2H2 Zn-finger protein
MIVSDVPTPYAVNCDWCGTVFLTEQEYIRQLYKPDSLWQCPKCGATAWWDDDNYDSYQKGGDTDEEDTQIVYEEQQ